MTITHLGSVLCALFGMRVVVSEGANVGDVRLHGVVVAGWVQEGVESHVYKTRLDKEGRPVADKTKHQVGPPS